MPNIVMYALGVCTDVSKVIIYCDRTCEFPSFEHTRERYSQMDKDSGTMIRMHRNPRMTAYPMSGLIAGT